MFISLSSMYFEALQRQLTNFYLTLSPYISAWQAFKDGTLYIWDKPFCGATEQECLFSSLERLSV